MDDILYTGISAGGFLFGLVIDFVYVRVHPPIRNVN